MYKNMLYPQQDLDNGSVNIYTVLIQPGVVYMPKHDCKRLLLINR